MKHVLGRKFQGGTRHPPVVASDQHRSWTTSEVALAVVFGLASVPWTYAFVTGGVPLWPAFIASAGFYAAGGEVAGLHRVVPNYLLGIGYASATLAITAALGGGVLVLSVVVGAFMLLGSLHALVDWLDFTPAVFLGYATLFSVNAAGATVFGLGGLAGETSAAVLSMVVGALIGLGTEQVAERLA